MAKKKKGEQRPGPYLAAAFFCENVVESKAGNLSAIQILDQIKVFIPADAPPDFPSVENKLPLAMAGLLSFKTGERPGDHRVRMVMRSPTGKVQTTLDQTIPFTQPPHGGGNLILRSTLKVNKGGLFLFDVYLDDKLMTTMPLHVTVERTQPSPTPVPSPSTDFSSAPAPANGHKRKKRKQGE
jgi:hypothetical protein